MMHSSEIVNLIQDDCKEMSIHDLLRILELQQIEKLTRQIAEQKLIKQVLEIQLLESIT